MLEYASYILHLVRTCRKLKRQLKLAYLEPEKEENRIFWQKLTLPILLSTCWETRNLKTCMMEILPKLKIRGKVAGNNQEPHVLYFLHHKGTIASAELRQKREDYWSFVYQPFKLPIELQNKNLNSRAKAAPCFSIKSETEVVWGSF